MAAFISLPFFCPDYCILMDGLLCNDYKPSAVKKINICRLFLQVESFAEIRDPTDL